ncbi:MAG: hypothetical protein JWP31_114 [Aeromicrobium sp.]|nr:hypothetical protein [Aeromicrobium sp.]
MSAAPPPFPGEATVPSAGPVDPPGLEAPRRHRTVGTVAVTTAVVLVLVGVATLAAVVGEGGDDPRSRPGAPTSAGPSLSADGGSPAHTTDDFGIVYTAEDAGASAAGEPVQVELYEDFQCPACQSFEAQSGAFLRDQVESGAITITYRPFSFLDEVGGSTNDYSKRATNAALCALDAGGAADYVTVHDHLYATQPDEGTAGPDDADLVAALTGLGIAGVDACVEDGQFLPWVEAAKNNAMAAGVNSTPTVVVGGRTVDRPDIAGLRAAITAVRGTQVSA